MSDLQLILATVGTIGDAIPFMAIGKALKTRGHKVAFITSADHQTMAEAHGLEFFSVSGPDWPQIGRDDSAFFREHLVPTYYNMERLMGRNVAHSKKVFAITRFGNWGALFSCERHAVPFINVLLQPAGIHENGHPISTADLFHLNRFRTDIGLPPIDTDRIKEPALETISLFADWFGQKHQSPLAGTYVGFPYLDDMTSDLPDTIKGFIERHGPPVVFSLGTGMQDISHFYALANQFAAHNGVPVLFLSKFVKLETTSGNPLLMAANYVEHSHLLPLARMIIHNGGIGVTAQAMRAALPQLIVPLMYDQPDNAMRITSLGLGTAIAPESLTLATLTAAFKALAFDQYRNRLRVVASKIASTDAVSLAVERIEESLRSTYLI